MTTLKGQREKNERLEQAWATNRVTQKKAGKKTKTGEKGSRGKENHPKYRTNSNDIQSNTQDFLLYINKKAAFSANKLQILNAIISNYQ